MDRVRQGVICNVACRLVLRRVTVSGSVPGAGHLFLLLLRIPRSRPSPRTFPQFVQVQVLGFLAAENDGFET